MIHLRQAVVVEGKYDKIRLSALVDGPILVTNGSAFSKTGNSWRFCAVWPGQDGILILTDSDAAGFKTATISNRPFQTAGFIMLIFRKFWGKRPVKTTRPKKGRWEWREWTCRFLPPRCKKAACCSPRGRKRTRHPDGFYENGLSGQAGQQPKAAVPSAELSLPHYLSAATLLEAVNALMTGRIFFGC